MKTETLRLYNGNDQEMTKELPRLFIHGDFNDTALAHVTKNTGLVFTRTGFGLEAQPTSSDQIVRLFLTYNFKTRYYDNWDTKNTLHLKHDHHVGFSLNSVCVPCLRYNHIPTTGLDDTARLSC